MKRRLKRTIASLLTVVMLLAVAPLNGFVGLELPDFSNLFFTKADAAEYSGKCGENLTWTFNEETGELVISGTGDMYTHSYSSSTGPGTPWYNFRMHIEKVIIESGITSISNYAFYNCLNLISIALPDTITEISSSAFYNTGYYNCESNWENNVLYIGNYLIKMDGAFIGDYVIKNGTKCIVEDAFENCSSLTSVTIPDSVIQIGNHAFGRCTGLTSITVPEGVISIDDYAFSGCEGLEKITIPSSVKKIGIGAFDSSTKLTDLYYTGDIASWCAFDFDWQPSFPTHNYNFYIDNILIKDELSIPYGVPSIGDYAFYHCRNLKKITIPDSVTQIGNSAFVGCSELTDLTMPISVKLFNYVFEGCINIEKITLTKGNGVMQNYYDGYSPEESRPWIISQCSSIIVEEGVVGIGKNTFWGCYNLTEITLPSSITHIGDGAFRNCTGLESITIPDNVINIGQNAFSGCENLESVTIGENISTIETNAFAYCPNLEYVMFSNRNSMEISEYIFNESPKAMICCEENSWLHSYADTNGLKVCMYDEKGIPSFEIKNDVLISYRGNSNDVFVSSAMKIGYGAFENNNDIKRVELSTAVNRIYDSAFKNCSALETIIIPQNVAFIGDDAFDGCDELTIYGYAGSYAESYAKKHGIDFKYITLTVSAETFEVSALDTLQLETDYNIFLNEEDEIVWSCDDNGVISITSTGKVTALSSGEAVVTATSSNGLSATCVIKVTDPVIEEKGKVHSVSVDNISLNYKDSTTITPVINADEGVEYTVTYSSSNPSVATVDENGKVTATGTGSAEISCTVTDQYGNTVSDTCEVTVKYTWWQWIIVIVLFGWIWY